MNADSPTLIEVYDAIAEGKVVEFKVSDKGNWQYLTPLHFPLTSDLHYKIQQDSGGHPHKEMIKAYARGAKIQFKVDPDSEWEDFDAPHFYPHLMYRVKPSTVAYKKYWYIDTLKVHKPISIGLVEKSIYYEGNWIPIGRSFINWIDEEWIEFEVPSDAS